MSEPAADRSYALVWLMATLCFCAAAIIGSSALALIATVMFGSGLALLLTTPKPPPDSIAIEVADDRRLVADIVEQYMGDPPRFDGEFEQDELERQIEARFAGWEMPERGIHGAAAQAAEAARDRVMRETVRR